MFDILEADIVIMQETKIQRKDLVDDMVLVPGWDVYFSLPKHKKGNAVAFEDAAEELIGSRILWRCHLYTKCDLCAYSSRRRNHGRPLPPQIVDQLPRPPGGPADWRVPSSGATLRQSR